MLRKYFVFIFEEVPLTARIPKDRDPRFLKLLFSRTAFKLKFIKFLLQRFGKLIKVTQWYLVTA